MKQRRRGFTLLETIVALLISTLAVAMVFQSLHVFALARDRVAAAGATMDRNRLALAWMRESAESLLATDAIPFKGERERWSGVSSAALLTRSGVPEAVQWQLSGDGAAAAAYRQNRSNKQLVLPMPAGRLHFVYVDAEGKAHRQWPPALGTYPQLPAAIALVSADRAQPLFIAAVLAHHDPLSNQGPFDAEGDQ